MRIEEHQKNMAKNNREDKRNSGRGITRRAFLSTTAAIAGSLPIVAGPFSAQSFSAEEGISHLVPVDKKLAKDWVASLARRGEPRLYDGERLNILGMPVGGIAAGQMYVTGDGTLYCWWIHNRLNRTGRRTNYQQPMMGMRLKQGYNVRIRRAGSEVNRTLDRDGFPNVAFEGQYPINKVFYRDEALPVNIEMKAYSPFIPLNTKDSAIPATLMEFTISNTSDDRVDVDLVGYLQNPAGVHSAQEGVRGDLWQRVKQERKLTCIEYGGVHTKSEKSPVRLAPVEIFADFEGSGYGDWKAEGKAMGTGPARGKIGEQGDVSGYQGEGLVNTYNPNDSGTGKLISPEFSIKRPFINFMIGGGSAGHSTFVRLLVDGREKERTSGKNQEKLDWRTWSVEKYKGEKARIEIVDNSDGRWGHINLDHIEFDYIPRVKRFNFPEQTDFGTACLAVLGKTDFASADIGAEGNCEALLESKESCQKLTYPLKETHCGALGRTVSLKPGKSKTICFLLTWYFPLRLGDYSRDTRHTIEKVGDENISNYYTNMFEDAREVVDYVRENYERLSGDTHLYHKTFYQDSTLPWWMLERIGHTPSILATETVQWRKNGRFWGWEGVGCCGGTCTHVWNYEQALARLFPELERTMREMQDFGLGFQPDGMVSFRGEIYWEPQYAADGQAGTILKAYREHQIGEDDAFLRRNWPRIKKALEYCISHDANGDGLIEDRQHNTYDCDFYGANTMVGSLYLGALRAGEEMARLMDDDDFARQCRAIFESGSSITVERFFDGEYFIQDSEKSKDKNRQYGPGCLADQLFGQSWAHQLGLGHIYPPEKVKSALEAIYKYNWTPDVAVHSETHIPHRWFAHAGEAGLYICTWPKSPRPGGRAEVKYRNEVWSGIEYQVAANMIYDGLIEEGLSIICGIHDRHNGIKQNPFNEVECGEHYARAMAAWGCLLAAGGFQYDGPKAMLTFSPRMQKENFKAFFSGAKGWGSLSQTEANGQRTCTVEVAWGALKLQTLVLDGKGVSGSDVKLRVDGKRKKAKVVLSGDGDRLTLDLGKITLKAGDKLEVRAQLA
jgi:uncharacterized protein (DUF608 family)